MVTEPNISITQEKLDAAMAQEPSVPLPAMTTRTLEEIGLSFSCPYLWEINTTDDASRLANIVYPLNRSRHAYSS